MIHKIYIFSIIVITIFIVLHYMTKNNEHDDEMKKILLIESIDKKKNNALEKLRKNTQACPMGNFNDPRSCYTNSDFQCSWNLKTKRCETK